MSRQPTCVLIPAYEPDGRLGALVDAVCELGLPVLVVDDGSSSDRAPVFDMVEMIEGAQVVHHERNRGKGAALKTGMKLLASQGFSHVVTADADGQHLPRDIAAVAAAAAGHPASLVLGVRDIDSMPLRSRAGNTVTRLITRAVCNVRVTETQTGLRGIPLARLDELLDLQGDGYEFEMEMLARSKVLFEGLVEVPIETVYEDNNAGSHFHTVRDGARVASVLLRMLPGYSLVSMSSFLVDYVLFAVFAVAFGMWVVAANAAARVVSATFNYTCNRLLVFRVAGREYTPLRYALLAVSILAVNSVLIWLFADLLGLPFLIVKIPVEIALYFVGFIAQSHLAARDVSVTPRSLAAGWEQREHSPFRPTQGI